jgi:hypothetical protein
VALDLIACAHAQWVIVDLNNHEQENITLVRLQGYNVRHLWIILLVKHSVLCQSSSRGLVVMVKDSWPREPGFKPYYGDHFSGTIHLDQSLEQKLWKTLTWHCCMCCNPENGGFDFKKWLAYKIQLHGTKWTVSLSADCDQSPKK